MPAHSDDQTVTNLLAEWRRGDEAALARLIPIVYQELRRVASSRLRGARLMREILVDHARRRNALRRGGEITAVRFDEAPTGAESAVIEVLALDEALTDLASLDERLCRVVELRYFAGLERRRDGRRAGGLPRDGRARLDGREGVAAAAPLHHRRPRRGDRPWSSRRVRGA